MLQRSLFPDGFELRELALAALRDLDPAAGLRFLARERAMGVALADLDALQQAFVWLDGRLGARPATAADAARLLSAVGADALAGQLGGPTAEFLDQALARFVLARAEPGLFAAGVEQVPQALAGLILGQARASRTALHEVVRTTASERGDHWGWFGDACRLDQRPEEAAAAYARALLFDAGGVDWWRLREARLAGCRERLVPVHGAEAADLVLAEAWIEGMLAIPPANGWLSAGQVERLLAATAAGARPRGNRCRRFSLLLFLDRTAALLPTDIARREEMCELLPDVFARFVRACEQRERRVSER